MITLILKVLMFEHLDNIQIVINIWMEPKQNEKNDFLKKREEYATEIRRQNRSELISKRRNINTQGIANQNNQNNHPSYSVDSRYSEYIDNFHKTKFFIQSLPQLIKSINDTDIIKQHYGAIGIRKILSSANQPPIQTVIDTGIVPRLIQLVNQQQYPQLQLESTWSLANIASGNRQQCQSVIDKGGIQFFIKLLHSPHLGIIQQAIWALGNIASDSSHYRDAIIRKGGINAFMHVIQTCKCQELVQSGAWALSNLCRGSPIPQYDIIREALFLLTELISAGKIKQEKTYADCSWCICYSFPKDKQQYQKLITKQLILELGNKLRSPQLIIVVPVLRIVGHITKLSNYYVDMLLQVEGVIDSLYELLYYQKKTVRMQTLWVISNITSGPQRHINLILGHEQLIVKILQLFQSDAEFIRRQICCLFSNMTVEGNPQTIFRFFKQVNILKSYVLALSSEDTKLVIESLDNIYNILELGQKMKQTDQINPFVADLSSMGALNLIQQLQFHDEQQVYNSVVKILKQYFEMEDNMDF